MSLSANPHPVPASRRAGVVHDCVVFCPGSSPTQGHDTLTKASLAAALARLLGIGHTHCLGDERVHGRPYFVPADTLLVTDAARLGIRRPGDLFGGVVPFPFVTSKVITHPLFNPDAAAPVGWSRRFVEQVADVVLEGYSAFSVADARRAGLRLLSSGALRLKRATGVGGAGQSVVMHRDELEATLAGLNDDELRRDGLVLERNLNEVNTHSIGQVQAGPWRVAYFGRQHLTRNHHGHEVYGGSSLHVVRGDLEDLLRHELPDDVRIATEQASAYHRAALAAFPGMFASRCNYDVAQGVDDTGAHRSGVLEQSWRIGGASGAEMAALQAFSEQPSLRWVDASTHEIYGDGVPVPAHAQLHFDGVDAEVGRLVKYAVVDGHGDT